jgi:Flp pilus assembly pilin Flp
MFNRFYAWATALIAESKSESGQTFVEYALLISVVAIGLLVTAFTVDLPGAMSSAVDKVVTAIG